LNSSGIDAILDETAPESFVFAMQSMTLALPMLAVTAFRAVTKGRRVNGQAVPAV
jgi:hypothetical protein